MSPPAKTPNGFPSASKSSGSSSMALPDNCNSSISMTQELLQMQMLEAQVIQGYRAPGQVYHPPPVEWVKNTLDGSILQDHKGYPVSVNRLLATKPLRAELCSRPGPGGKKLTYISGEGVTRTLNEVFGFDGWDMQIVNTTQVECVRDDKGRYHVAYTAQVRLTHKKSGTFKEDVGASDSIDRIMGTAVAHALKGSITDALKRAARHFGEKLGNTLYMGDFTINKAPLTLKDALDQYDNERQATKFGPSTTPIGKEAVSVETQNNNITASGGNHNQNNTVVPAKNAPQKPVATTGVAKPNHPQSTGNQASSNIQEMRGNVPAITKTPSNNSHLVASKQNPIVSATPKLPIVRESQESLKNRLGPAPNFQLPASRQSLGSSNASGHHGGGGAIIRPPVSAADRLSSGNMFTGGCSFDLECNPSQKPNAMATGARGTNLSTFSAYHGSMTSTNQNVNKENALQNGNKNTGRPGTSHGRNITEPTAMEWSRGQQPQAGGPLKRPATSSAVNGDTTSTSNKKFNANPYGRR